MSDMLQLVDSCAALKRDTRYVVHEQVFQGAMTNPFSRFALTSAGRPRSQQIT